MEHKHQWQVADTYRHPGNSQRLSVTWACICGAFKTTEKS